MYQGKPGDRQLQGQPGFNPYIDYVQLPYQGYPYYVGIQRPIAQVIPSFPRYAQPDLNWQFPFVATLKLLDLNQLTNDPILYAPWRLVIPYKLPSDIPKFYGNPRQDLPNHVMNFHLWCYLNSLNDDSVRLSLFQRTLTGLAAKWYI